MSTVSYDAAEREWDPEEPPEPLPRRPRRQFFNRKSAALVALITCAAGFYAGVRVEKGQVSGSSTALRLPGATAAAAGAARTGAARTGASRTAAAGAAGATRSGAAGASRAGGFPGFAGGAAGNASVGTVASVNGRTIVLTETSGNTVKIQLSSSTKITKNQSVSRHAVRPGDTLIVQGAPNSKGTTVAASVTDSGASSTGSGSSSSGGSSSGSSSGTSGGGVGSLFSSGG
jgi:hypothetical protein